MTRRPTGVSNVRKVSMEWTGRGMEFVGCGVDPPSPSMVMDGAGEAGPSPMQALLLAAAGCSGSDVVHIMGKMRITLQRLTIDVQGVRRVEHPRRYVSMLMVFTMRGEGLTQEQAERAVDLSVTKYCSVIQTLAPDVKLTHEVVLA